MSVEGQPTVPDEKITPNDIGFTWGVFKDKDGIPFFGVVPFVKGKPMLTQVMKLTETLEEFQHLYSVVKQVMEGNKRPTFYG